MKKVTTLISPKALLAGITFPSSVALSSSLYLQYVAGYPPCVYCYILRYLTLGMLVVSVIGQYPPNLVGDVSAALAGASLIGLGLSAFLITDELFPTAGFCNACAFAPFVLGISLYYYSLAFMSTVLGLSLAITLRIS